MGCHILWRPIFFSFHIFFCYFTEQYMYNLLSYEKIAIVSKGKDCKPVAIRPEK